MISSELKEEMRQRGYGLGHDPLVVIWVANGQTEQHQMHYPQSKIQDAQKFAREIGGALYIEWQEIDFPPHKILTKFQS